jgi:hypothetical protein
MNFGDLTPYLTYVSMSNLPLHILQHFQIQSLQGRTARLFMMTFAYSSIYYLSFDEMKEL